jgi:methyl-accepting chemotaxis protein
MDKKFKAKFSLSTQNEAELVRLLDKFLEHLFAPVLERIGHLQIDLNQVKELLMGMKEDFDKFVEDVNTATNAISASLETIKTELENADPESPEAMKTAIANATNALQAAASAAAAIAAGDTPVVPEPL